MTELCIPFGLERIGHQSIDGIFDVIEASGPNNGDSNNDGTLDSLQKNVACFRTYNDQGTVILETTEGTALSSCEAVENPSPGNTPSGVEFDHGFFKYTISDIPADGNVTLTITLIDGNTPNTYYKFGKIPENQTNHWYQFLYDGETGVEFNGNKMTIHFLDALRGDDILIPDSKIIEPGGPGFIDTESDDDDGGGGGGCYMDTLRYNIKYR